MTGQKRLIRTTAGGATGNVVDLYRYGGVLGSPTRLFDYQTGDFSQWLTDAGQYNRPEQLQIVTDHPHGARYPYAARFEVTPTDYTFGITTTVRGEVRSLTTDLNSPAEGDLQWFAWSLYLPTDFYWDVPYNFIFTQFHHTGSSGQPNMAFWISKTPQNFNVFTRGGDFNSGNTAQYSTENDLGPVTLGQWMDIRVRVKWSSDPTIGHLTVWINGVQVMAKTNLANLFVNPIQTIYLKQGIYAASATTLTHVIYETGTRWGVSGGTVA